MKLERPIVFFDVETTGIDTVNDRIIEVSMVKLDPSGNTTTLYHRINPGGHPISDGAFSKHGISMDELEDEPTFKEVADELHNFIMGCDMGGYNCKRFDVAILIEEFIRAGIAINIRHFSIVDVYKILLKAEPRTLEATYERFTGKKLENAHSAEADVLATMEILERMEERFDLPDTPKELDKFAFEDEMTVDLENKLKYIDGNIVFNFGKHKGKTSAEVFMNDVGYFDWLINSSDMSRYTRSIFQNLYNYHKKQMHG